MSRLSEALERGEFVVTGEVAPPLGTDLEPMLRSARAIARYCHAINVTDNQGAALHLSSLGGAHALLRDGIEPVWQQTCRDRNRLGLQSDLLTAWTMGIRNALVITGDDPRMGDHPQARGVFDVDSTQLLGVVSGMNEGHDMLGRELAGGTGFFLGAALFPEAEPWDIQLGRAERKVAAGARFFQTQAVMDTEKLARAVDALRGTGVKVVAGVLLLKSPRVVDFINERLAGLMVPEPIAERIRRSPDPMRESIVLAAEQVRAVREIADGVHLMPLGADAAVKEVLETAGIT